MADLLIGSTRGNQTKDLTLAGGQTVLVRAIQWRTVTEPPMNGRDERGWLGIRRDQRQSIAAWIHHRLNRSGRAHRDYRGMIRVAEEPVDLHGRIVSAECCRIDDRDGPSCLPHMFDRKALARDVENMVDIQSRENGSDRDSEETPSGNDQNLPILRVVHVPACQSPKVLPYVRREPPRILRS